MDELLTVMDRTAANLAKLQDVWNRAARFVPTGPARGSHPEYDNLRRAWKDLMAGLPPIDGWTITDELPDIDELGQDYIDCFDISVAPFEVHEAGEKPGKELAEDRFGQGHDWHDIHEFNWPSVRPDVQAAGFTNTDPLPVPDFDLGQAAAGRLTGTATIALPWDRLDADGFERLLYDLLRAFSEHQNVRWLMQTRAPDRGRDLSLERVLQTSTGEVRTERVIVQAKHWLKRSVGVPELAATLAGIKLWVPPVVHFLIIATSGRFSADAVA